MWLVVGVSSNGAVGVTSVSSYGTVGVNVSSDDAVSVVSCGCDQCVE